MLQSFEFKKQNKDYLTKLLLAMKCYLHSKDIINYYKLIRQMYRLKNQLSRAVLEFEPIKKTVNIFYIIALVKPYILEVI